MDNLILLILGLFISVLGITNIKGYQYDTFATDEK